MQALIVDDSRVMRAILARTLTKVGMKVVEAVDGQDALNKLEEHGCVNVALVDWNMPVMNGYEFVREVRADSRYADMWLMMVTTESENASVVKAMAAGANEYLMKPFTEDALLGKLRLLGLVTR